MPKTEKKAFLSLMGFRRIYLIFFLLGVVSSASCSESDAGIVSDDFNDKTLDEIWTFIDPVGDASMELVGAGTEDAHLLLSVPAGTSHDVWKGNHSARVMQSAADADFEVEVKFESQPTEKYQIQGLLVEEDEGNFLRFDVNSDGSNLKLFAAHFINGSPTAAVNQTVAEGPTIYLRVTRQADQWTLQYGHDGVNWIAETSFAHPLTVSAVGVFVGNSGGNPAYTAVVDYFFNTEKPIIPEDGANISSN